MRPRIAVIVITWNRLPYTRVSLPKLLSDRTEDFDLYIWDNGSQDGTVEYLHDAVDDPRIVERHFSPANVGQGPPIEWAWRKTRADLVGKVDNDCLVTPGWTRPIAEAHADVSMLGGIGCWHFRSQDFDERLARHKMRQFGSHRVVTHPYLDGSAFLVKRADYVRARTSPSRCTRFWLELARQGRVNGWYYPLILQDHMDDPRSKYFNARESLGLTRNGWGLTDLADYDHWLRQDARHILTAPSDVRFYTGWRALLRRARKRASACAVTQRQRRVL